MLSFPQEKHILERSVTVVYICIFFSIPSQGKHLQIIGPFLMKSDFFIPSAVLFKVTIRLSLPWELNRWMWLSGNNFISFSRFYLFERHREGERTFPSTVQNPYAHNSWDWAWPKAVAGNSTQVSHVGGSNPVTSAITCCFPESAWAGRKNYELKLGIKPMHSNVGQGHLKKLNFSNRK